MASSVSVRLQVRTPSKYWERCCRALVTVTSRLLYVFSAARFWGNNSPQVKHTLCLKLWTLANSNSQWRQIWSRCPQLDLKEHREAERERDPHGKVTAPVTWAGRSTFVVHHRQRRNTLLHEDAQCRVERRVCSHHRDVAERSDVELLQGLVQKRRFGHLRYLGTTRCYWWMIIDEWVRGRWAGLTKSFRNFKILLCVRM